MLIKKLNQLEKCKVKGWLDFGDKRITALDRLQAGQRLFIDYTKSCLPSTKAINFELDRVDGGNMKEMPESVAMARQRFHEAIRAIKEYSVWFMVRTIVLEDRKVGLRKLSSHQYNHEMELMKEDLCQGLDILAFHYGFTPCKPRAIRSFAFVDEDYVEMPRRYELQL